MTDAEMVVSLRGALQAVETECAVLRKDKAELRNTLKSQQQQMRETDHYAGNWERAGEAVDIICQLMQSASRNGELSDQDLREALAAIRLAVKNVRDPRPTVQEIPF